MSKTEPQPDYWVGLREGDLHPIGIFPGDKKPSHWDERLLLPVWMSAAVATLKLLLWRLNIEEDLELSDDAFPTAKAADLIVKVMSQRAAACSRDIEPGFELFPENIEDDMKG